jgi:hypothetical protein
VITNSEVWDLRTFGLLRSVPCLDGAALVFSPAGDVIYATQKHAPNNFGAWQMRQMDRWTDEGTDGRTDGACAVRASCSRCSTHVPVLDSSVFPASQWQSALPPSTCLASCVRFERGEPCVSAPAQRSPVHPSLKPIGRICPV